MLTHLPTTDSQLTLTQMYSTEHLTGVTNRFLLLMTGTRCWQVRSGRLANEKLDSNGYAPSILSKSPTCLICGRYRTARHEVFFGPYRDKSKRLGLWANLCPWCHQNGVTAVHTNREADLRLKKWAQKKAMEYYGWPEAQFVQEFGRSYL